MFLRLLQNLTQGQSDGHLLVILCTIGVGIAAVIGGIWTLRSMISDIQVQVERLNTKLSDHAKDVDEVKGDVKKVMREQSRIRQSISEP